MAVYSLLDAIDTKGMKIYPVCTHEESGLGMTDRMLLQSYPDASIMKGLAIRGTAVQNNVSEVEKMLKTYLEDCGFSIR